jgi:hypothetical protein
LAFQEQLGAEKDGKSLYARYPNLDLVKGDALFFPAEAALGAPSPPVLPAPTRIGLSDPRSGGQRPPSSRPPEPSREKDRSHPPRTTSPPATTHRGIGSTVLGAIASVFSPHPAPSAPHPPSQVPAEKSRSPPRVVEAPPAAPKEKERAPAVPDNVKAALEAAGISVRGADASGLYGGRDAPKVVPRPAEPPVVTIVPTSSPPLPEGLRQRHQASSGGYAPLESPSSVPNSWEDPADAQWSSFAASRGQKRDISADTPVVAPPPGFAPVAEARPVETPPTIVAAPPPLPAAAPLPPSIKPGFSYAAAASSLSAKAPAYVPRSPATIQPPQQ